MDGNDVKLKKPFFVFNPKSYLYGEDLLALAKLADDTAQRYQDEISVFVTAPFSDLSSIAAKTRSIIVTAQHMDSIRVGRGMGHVGSGLSCRSKGVFFKPCGVSSYAYEIDPCCEKGERDEYDYDCLCRFA